MAPPARSPGRSPPASHRGAVAPPARAGSSPIRSRRRARLGRSELLAAAAQEFADHGYSGATTAGIARRAGVTQPLVHHHFGSKEGLWIAVIDELFGGLAQEMQVRAWASRGMSGHDRVRHILLGFVRYTGMHPELARLLRTEGAAGGKAFDLLYFRWISGLVRLFRTQIEQAQRDGIFVRADPAFLYFIIAGASTAGFSEPELARRAFRLDTTTDRTVARFAETAVDTLLRGMLTPRAVRASHRRRGAAGRPERRRARSGRASRS